MSFDASFANLIYALPFVGVLLSISIGPVIFTNSWHKHFLKVAIAWSVLGMGFMVFGFGFQVTGSALVHTLIHEYFPFIIMIGALYTITGGIHIAIAGHATPYSNVAYLAFGAVLASLVGTTGAAMLLIRPLIQINRFRRHKQHLVIFFIIIVANIGGSLSPLGDPPLFLGYLNGVPFLWPLKSMLYPFILVVLPVLTLFFIIDFYLFQRDPKVSPEKHSHSEAKISITGKINFILLIGVVLTVALSGAWHDSPYISLIDLNLNELMRDLLLLTFGVFQAVPGLID